MEAIEGHWSHEEYLPAILCREVAAREVCGAETRTSAVGFPAHKLSEYFSFDHQPGLKRDVIAHLGTATYLATGLGLRAPQLGYRVLFAIATEWVTWLQTTHQSGRLPQELLGLRRYGLLVVDEVGYIPFEQEAAKLFFQLVSSRYEHASLIRGCGISDVSGSVRQAASVAGRSCYDGLGAQAVSGGS